MSWVLIVLSFRAFETVFFINVDLSSHAYLHYGFQLLMNIGVILAIHFRWRLYFAISRNPNPDEVYGTNADFSLMLVYLGYALIVLLAMLEHLLRHLYDIGLPEEWSINSLVIYNNYEELKLIINLIECAVLMSAFTRYHRSARFVHA